MQCIDITSNMKQNDCSNGYRDNMPRDLSPTATTLKLVPAGFSGMAALIARTMLECVEPQRPRSDVIATIKWFGFFSSCVISAFS